MPRYLSPLVTEGDLNQVGLSTVAQSATTVFTTLNNDDNNGELIEVDVYLRVRTLDGGTSPTLGISITYTDAGSARTMVVPLAAEAGSYGTSISLGAVNSASGKVMIRCDKNTNVQVTRVAGGTPSNNGVFDVLILFNRVR